jgi:transcription initiation factor TFIIIB Brf1 subunit/transcription initiation factor TFIIB
MSTTPDTDSVEGRLTNVVERLEIPDKTHEISQVRLNRLTADEEIAESGIDEAAAAGLALSCRQDGIPISEGELVETWAELLEGGPADFELDHEDFQRRLEAVADVLDVEDVPPHPYDLVRAYGEDLDMDDQVVDVAQRILHDVFDIAPAVAAGGPSPAATAGATLSVAAELNGLDDQFTHRDLGETSGAGGMTVKNRYRDIRAVFEDERLAAEAYQLEDPGAGDAGEEAVADGEGAAETATADEPAEPDAEAAAGEPDAADDPDESAEAAEEAAELTPGAVEDEVDALAEDLTVDPTIRLFARGIVSDAADVVAGADPAELAAAALVAGSRREDGDVDAADVAGDRAFAPRDVAKWIGRLDDAIDVDIPKLDAPGVVDAVAEDLGLPEDVAAEGHTALEQFETAGGDTADYTAHELGAGAVFFAATVGPAAADIELQGLAEAAGADPGFVTESMNDLVVTLCLGLVRGDFAYADCAWTEDLLESELTADLGGSETGRAITLAKTYTAGREGEHVADETLDVVIDAE